MYAVDSTIDMKVTVYVDLCAKFYNLYESTSKSEFGPRRNQQSSGWWGGRPRFRRGIWLSSRVSGCWCRFASWDLDVCLTNLDQENRTVCIPSFNLQRNFIHLLGSISLQALYTRRVRTDALIQTSPILKHHYIHVCFFEIKPGLLNLVFVLDYWGP